MDKPEPLSDDEILDLLENAGLLTTAKFRIINGLVRSRPASVVREIVDRTQRIVAARYEAQLAGITASRDQWKTFADSLIDAGERREAQIAQQRNIMMDEIERLRAERDALRADAERYRCLRGRDLNTIDVGGVFAGLTPQNVVLNGEDLDAAVDAIRAETPNA